MAEKEKSDKSEKKDRPGTIVVHASTIVVDLRSGASSPDPKTKGDKERKR